VLWALERREDPGALLARLFVYDDRVPRGRLESLLGAPLCATLRDTGLLAPDPAEPESLCARFRLVPFHGLWVLADDPGSGPDAVMGPGATSSQLARYIPDSGLGAVLDVGCGAGTFALLAALRGARRAVGTDIHPRAIEMARLNARLNDVRASFVIADLVEPLRGGAFDLVVAQPPYVVQPPGTETTTFLHGGPSGEELALRLFATLPALLTPGGRALVLADAAVRAEPLHERFRRALGDAPVDLVLLAGPGPPPDLQAAGYAQLEAGAFGPRYEAATRRYRQHFETLGTREFRHVLAIVRAARPGAPARPAMTVTVPVTRLGAADHATLERYLSGLDLAVLPDEQLVGRAIKPIGGASWIQERERPGAELATRLRVEPPAGALACAQELSSATMVLLRALDESETLAEAVDRYAAACEAVAEDVRPRVLEFVRHSLASGLLEAPLP
jgi:SAM-dependent methyltransferase